MNEASYDYLLVSETFSHDRTILTVQQAVLVNGKFKGFKITKYRVEVSTDRQGRWANTSLDINGTPKLLSEVYRAHDGTRPVTLDGLARCRTVRDILAAEEHEKRIKEKKEEHIREIEQRLNDLIDAWKEGEWLLNK